MAAPNHIGTAQVPRVVARHATGSIAHKDETRELGSGAGFREQETTDSSDCADKASSTLLRAAVARIGFEAHRVGSATALLVQHAGFVVGVAHALRLLELAVSGLAAGGAQ